MLLLKQLHTAYLFGFILLALNANGQCPGMTPSFTANQTDYCGTAGIPYAGVFTNTTTGASGATNFDWYVNGSLFDQTNTVAQTANTNFTAAGSYVIMMVANDSPNNCSDTAYVTVNVYPQPNAGFNYSPANQCAFQPVNFTNTSTGTTAGTSYSWNFGSGQSSTQTNPSNTYNGPGNYNVTLTVTNGPGCTSTSTQVVTIVDAPIVNISGDDGDGDLNYCLFPGDNTTSEVVTFSNSTTGATSYTWDFGDGTPPFTTGSNAPFTHTYNTYGTFTVTMTATGPNGCQTTETLTVVFEKFVSASLTLSLTEYSGCAPHLLSTLTNLSQNANTYIWDFGDGSTFTTTTPTPPAYAYTSAGTYTISLTASNSCNTASATISPIIIIDGPTANFTPSVTNGCAPQNISFTNQSSGTQPANNYQWNMGNGNTYTSTTTPPVQTYPTSGSYDIQLVAGNACGYDTIVHTVIIDTIPTVDLILDPITGCAPLTVNPTATLLTGNNVNWQWYIDGVYTYTTPFDIPDQTFNSLNPNDSTLHTIQVNVSNNCGSDFDKDSVYVHPPVIANFTTQDTVCLGTAFTFTNLSTGTELSYEWNFGDGSPLNTSTSPTYTYASAGTYTVTLTTTGHCGVDISTFDVTVVDIPIADFVANPSPICSGESISITNNSSVNGSFSWSFGANASPSSSTVYSPGSITYSGSGTQQIILFINYAGCTDADTAYIDVEALPVAQFTTNPTLGCSPLTVSFTNTTIDQPGYSYEWTFGNGNTSTAYNPNDEIYTTTLVDVTYPIQLVVNSTTGCSDTLVNSIIVSPLPTADFTILEDTICLGESMLFANNSIGASSYMWDFGDGSTSTMTSPGHTFNQIGNFTVTLVANTAAGCTDTMIQDIFIDSIPTASFTNTTECLGGITLFTNTSTGSPVSYSWDFGDGSPIETITNPSHQYAAAGSYLVQLTATNGVNCTNTISQLVQVNQVPIADFNWSQTCLGQQMNFSDATLNNPIGWAWDFGDGNTSLIQNPSHQYADTGAYTVQLVVSGGSGCLDSITQTVYVDSIPQANFDFVNVCATDTTYFTDLSIYSPNNFTWDFGDGTFTSTQSPFHIYNSSGSYNVTLTVQYGSNGCTSSITQAIEAFPRTTPAFTANTPCLGDSTLFADATGGSPTMWQWDFGDGTGTSSFQNPSHEYAAMGIYTIQLVTENSYGCIDTLYQDVEIHGLPTADFTNSVVCEGSPTNFTDNSIDDVSWQWFFGELGATSTLENPIYTYSTNGTFSPQLVVFNQYGCSDTISYSVTVNPNPTANFTVDTACYGYINSFTDNSIDAVAWNYNFGDGTSSTLSDPTHIYPNDGTFTVQQLVTNIFGCSDSISANVLVYPQPETGFINNTVCAADVVDFSDTTLGAPTTWSWDFGDGSSTSTLQNPTHVYQIGGTYTITLIAGNSVGCLDTTIADIQVYTNPTPFFEADTVCFLEVTTFTDLSIDSVPLQSWYYDFGDNINNSNLQNPTYIYQAPGIYPATLTVTNINGCDSTVTINVVVNNIPVADFDYDTVCWGSPTTFTDISLGAVNSWNWDFGDGTTSTVGPTVQHTYANSGTYIASMEVDGGAGCTDIMYHAVTVIDVLTPVIGADDTVCVMEQVQFTDLSQTTSGTVTGWLWNFGDGTTSTVQNPVHSYSNSGSYTVTLDVTTSTGCVNQGTFTIDVFDLPTNDFTFTIPCEGQPTIFSDSSYDNSGSIVTWNWDFGDGSPNDNTTSPQHQYAVAGNYNVTSIVTSEFGCSTALTQTVTIYPSPTADFNFTTECGGVPVELFDNSMGNIVNYNWIYGGQTFSNAQNPQHVFPTTTDTHPVTLIVTTDLGCIDSITKDVMTHPVVNFDYGPEFASGCPVFEAQFFDNSITTGGGGIINWLWNMGDSSYSFAQNPVHYYEEEGTYYVSLQVITAEDCIYYDTLTYGIIVYPKPTAGFVYSPSEIIIHDPEVTFTNTSQGAMNVEWHFGDYDYSNDWDPVHTYPDTGYYLVNQTVSNAYGCIDTISQWLYVQGDIVLYLPNTFTPNGDGMNDYFNLSGFGFHHYELLIFDRWGTLIKTITDLNDSWDGTYMGTQCQDGVYVWKLRAVDYDFIPHIRTGHVSILR